MEKGFSNESVRYSRAGDAFHYRWAARRCLKMIHPTSRVQYIVIEGTNDEEREALGEYAIDVSEYLGNNADEISEINYYQLKHTTVKENDHFHLSDLKKTIAGFANKYKNYIEGKSNEINVHFYLVTNRLVSKELKTNILKLVNNQTCGNKFINTIQNYTGFSGETLTNFCKCLTIMDGVGDYNEQRWELQVEISQLLAGSVEHSQVDAIIALVTEKALTGSNGIIYPEDILKRFDCTSVRDMYPAPAKFENNNDIVLTQQHQELAEMIQSSQGAIIIHAAGGVGKSVFAQTISRYLKDNSIAIIYDCFGAGTYRTPSQPRHRHRDGLIQIINELAGEGLCDPVIAQSAALNDEILRKFLSRLQIAINNLRIVNNLAQIIIVIDAADNAEMAAKESGGDSFVHGLLCEQFPDGCYLVMLCRTERIHLLQPGSTVERYEMFSFSEKETLSFLRKSYPNATEADSLEFHRLTNGNPRIQAYALDTKLEYVSDVLEKIGPTGTTVEIQIENQLDMAINKVKDLLPRNYQEQIAALCCGLAVFPPLIPIEVLSAAAEVEESTVKSFVADLGRPLWITDSVVQFRDEPTETWFRQKFSRTPQQFAEYITRLKPLANRLTYVAGVLPSLYLQAELYPELIELALSDKLLPCDNPIDSRNIRIYRLQFAFKAALREKQCSDAIKIAMLAGKEMAGNERQLEIFKKNPNLIATLQDTLKVQELAFKRALKGRWEGSENVYSASLLSNVKEFHGEARSYLRASQNWLNIYFREREKNTDRFVIESLEYQEIAEMAFTYYNLEGIEVAVDFILKWKPSMVIYNVALILSKKMIDLNRIDQIMEMAKFGAEDIFFILALVHELLRTGIFLDSIVLENGLETLSKGAVKLPGIDAEIRDNMLASAVSFAETCAVRNMPGDKIIRLLSFYFPNKTPAAFSSDSYNETRDIFLRVVALRKSLCPDMDISIDKLLPEEFLDRNKNRQYERELTDHKEFLGGLLPWYLARSHILLGNSDDLATVIRETKEASREGLQTRYRRYDTMNFEISQVCVDILLLCRHSTKDQIFGFYNDSIKNNESIKLDSLIQALHGANRLEHLSTIRSQLDTYAHDSVEDWTDDTETRAERYVDLARATIPVSIADAAAYFNLAIEIVSRFGHELTDRWKAIASLAHRSCDERHESAELAYRFIRCAELVGEEVLEKYFDRDDAAWICTKLAPSSGLAAMSRWRDRNVGLFDNQFPIVAAEIVDMGLISPKVAWGLAPLFKESSLPDFVKTCLEKETSTIIQSEILDWAIDYLRLHDTPIEVWQRLLQIKNNLGIKNEKLDGICSFYSKELKEKIVVESRYDKNKLHKINELQEITETELKIIFAGLDLTQSVAIDTAIHKFFEAPHSYSNKDIFWKYLFTQIKDGDIVKFFYAFTDSEQIDLYDIEVVLTHIPEHWKGKPSVVKSWLDIIRQLAKNKAIDLVYSTYRLERFFNALSTGDSERVLIYEAMIEGLLSQENQESADAFFGFVTTAANLLTPTQARKLLEDSIAGLEMYMEDDFADGEWAEWLQPPADPGKAIAGFIWSSLGSPSSEMRWRAAHCVKRLGENGCQNEIDALIEWLIKDHVGTFGSNKFPFYNLHARLYLLIAFARLSMDKPELLLKHASVFSRYALDDMPHILIQMFASKTAINIESAFPKTYEEQVLDLLLNVAKSPFPIKENIHRYEYTLSYLHQEGKVNTDLHFYHGYDFERYWFEPLGRVFGISAKQVEELATMVVHEEWRINNDDHSFKDPRQSLWNSPRNEGKTYYSHGEYPDLETYDFYLSYHAMLVVASRLLQKMPILCEYGWDEEDPWKEWLMQYSLCRDDGFWLYDQRDVVPLRKPGWLQEEISDEWIERITDDDFLEALLLNDEQNDWLNVYGYWEYGRDSCRENVGITSALVSCEISQALLYALNSCENPYDFKLPEYGEEKMKFEESIFKIKGWVVDEYSENGVDRVDKLSGNVYYPVYRVGESIAEKINIHADEHFRNWYTGSQKERCLTCQNWSYDIYNVSKYNEMEPLLGKKLSTSLKTLQRLCIVEKCELIIKVQIRRWINRNHYSNSGGKDVYRPPKHKIFVISQEGELRDEHGSIRFR